MLPVRVWVVGALAHLAGCGSPPLEFTPNRLEQVQHDLVTPHQQQIATVLTDLFGTPDFPAAPEITGLDMNLLWQAAGPVGYAQRTTEDQYQQRGLFRQHCVTCHGVTGDGYGPNAAVLSPYPRDFRPGVFKFKSTYLPAKPTDDDLRRILREGVPGTAMPSFRLLELSAGSEAMDALVEYVKYLSMRGEVERELIAVVADEFDSDLLNDSTSDPLDPKSDPDDRALVDEMVAQVARRWQQAEQQLVPESGQATESLDGALAADEILAGEQLFFASKSRCVECHGTPGQGGGLREYDDWNLANAKFREETAVLAKALAKQQMPQADASSAETVRWGPQRLTVARGQLAARQEVVAQLLDPQQGKPHDFGRDPFHGGSAPWQVFLRIHQGVAGTSMPAHGSPRPGIAGALTDQQIWQLVHYLRSQAPGTHLPNKPLAATK